MLQNIFNQFEESEKKLFLEKRLAAIQEDRYVAASHANICVRFLPAVYIHLKVYYGGWWGGLGGYSLVSAKNILPQQKYNPANISYIANTISAI